MAYNDIMDMQPTQDVMTKRAASLTQRAYRHLLWETYAPTLALGALFVLLFTTAAAFGLWQRIGDPWRLIGLSIAAYFVVKSALAARQRLRPTQSQARRRVERDSGLAHRPLDTLVDTPALNADDTAWQNHLVNAQIQIQRAGTSSLRPTLAPMDKYFLRIAAPILLLLAFMVGAGDNYERLRASLTPGWIYGMSAKTAHFEAWIDPPQYTGRPPSYFKDQQSMDAPEGSEFVARISGLKTAPRLVLHEGNRTRRITAKRLGPQSFEARVIITKGTVASYRIGQSEKIWVLNVAKDLHPIVRFDVAPDAGKRDRLIFTYSLSDDYGVENLLLSMALESDPETSEQISVTLPGSSVRSAAKEPGGVDLTKHKWAGKKVQGRLLAIDGKRQIGSTAMYNFVVPDKIFVEPLAKAVAEQRQLILAGMDAKTVGYAPYPKEHKVKSTNKPLFAVERPDMAIDRAPATVQRTALLIDAITDKPVGVFEDPSVYMGLRNIYRRLQTAQAVGELGGIPEDLWTIALRAEFGRLGNAKEDMQRAERALNNAMARRAPQREVDALFDRYNEAVDRYMEFLMLEAAKNAQEQSADGEGGGDADFNTDEIQALLDAIEEANRMGDTVAARKALAKLAQLLENMKIQLAQGGGGSGSGVGESMSEELKEALEDLNDVLGEQRRLRDETQDAGRAEADMWDGQQEAENKQPGDQPSGSELADQQGQIADMLGALEDAANGQNGTGKQEDESMGGEGEEDGSGGVGGADIKQALEDAKDAMGLSEQSLKDGEFYSAGRAQSDAIDALRQAGEGLLEQEAERLKAEQGEEGGQKANKDGLGNADPFGREDGNSMGEADTDIPEKSDQQRARELLEELRRRSGERERGETEREYLERLLERF
jgi:Domain of unknown function (DUF4175)